ncbi:hypothetical protein OROGR_029981 [Orobanche gracilis]
MAVLSSMISYQKKMYDEKEIPIPSLEDAYKMCKFELNPDGSLTRITCPIPSVPAIPEIDPDNPTADITAFSRDIPLNRQGFGLFYSEAGNVYSINLKKEVSERYLVGDQRTPIYCKLMSIRYFVEEKGNHILSYLIGSATAYHHSPHMDKSDVFYPCADLLSAQ